MTVAWARGEVSVHDVRRALAERGLAYTTVMTVMNRLADKHVLQRERRGRAFVYRPVQESPQSFLRQQARARMRALLHQFGDLAVAAFVAEVGQTDPEQLAALKELLDADTTEVIDG